MQQGSHSVTNAIRTTEHQQTRNHDHSSKCCLWAINNPQVLEGATSTVQPELATSPIHNQEEREEQHQYAYSCFLITSDTECDTWDLQQIPHHLRWCSSTPDTILIPNVPRLLRIMLYTGSPLQCHDWCLREQSPTPPEHPQPQTNVLLRGQRAEYL